MDHPNIAQIHDGGTTPDGRPFFVMELVKGIPITDYCDRCSLTTRERLELLLSACHAVQHAHQKGVIHRDLKPSNVLVAIQDGKPAVKVIDFGVAKAINQRLSEHTLATGFHQMVGTPLYMSPEQAEMSPLDVDTRADIYSLGVLLYELLTGTTPLEKERLSQASYDELRRLIREEEPHTPSARLSTLQDRLAAVAAQRRTDPRQLLRTVRGELDWIAMKCLEKDRNRRYETANALALDLQRYLADEPVQACPPSAWYRARKFARRNRAPLAFAGLTLLFLVLLGAGLGWVSGDRAARRQLQSREADDALGRAAHCLEEGNWPEATAWARRAEGVLAHGEGDPAHRERLQAVRADLDMVADLHEIRIQQSRMRGQRFDQFAADAEFARAFRSYGIDVEALGIGEAAAAIRARRIRLELVLALDDWAGLRRRRPAGVRGWQDLLAVARAADDDDNRDRLRQALGQQPVDCPALQRLAASDALAKLPATTLVLLGVSLRRSGAIPDAVAVLRQAQQRYPNNFWANHELAYSLTVMQPPRWPEALRFYTVALGLRPESPAVRVNLGAALAKTGDLDGAFAAYREAIRLKPDFAAPYYNRALAYHDVGQQEKAIADYTRAIELKPDHAEAWCSRGLAYHYLGQQEKAVADYTKAIELKPDLAPAWNNRGNVHRLLGRRDQAIADYTRAIELKTDYAQPWANRGDVHAALGRNDKAIADYTRAIELSPDYVEAWYKRGGAYLELGRREKAVADYTKAIELKPDYASAWYNRGNAHRLLGQREKALADYTRAIELKPDHARAWGNRGVVHAALGQPDKAIADYTRAIELQPDNAIALNGRAIAYYGLGQWEKAVADSTRAIELKSDYSEAWCNRGNAYHELGQQGKAIADYTRAIDLKPAYALAWHNRGLAYQRLDKLDRAVADYTRAIELKSDYVQAWNNRGMAHWMLDQPARAVADYSKALEVKPDHVSAWNNRAAAYLKLGQREKAVADCTRALELQPKYVNAWINRGDAYRALAQWDKALADYSKAGELAPASPVALNKLAWLLATCPESRLRDPRRAVELARKATQLLPKQGACWYTLGVAHYRAPSPKEALAALNKSMELRKDGDGSGWFFLAMAHWQLGDKDQARRWYDRAVEWMEKNRPQDEELRRFRAEAEEVLQIKKK
jgi:tetratricopeptide (TPR) repeat protein